MKDSWFYIAVFSFIGGVALRSFFNIDLGLIIVLVLTSVAAFCYLTFSKNLFVLTGVRQTVGPATLVTIAIFSLAIGILRYEIGNRTSGDPNLNALLEKPIKAVGIVVEEPDERENSTLLTIKLDQVVKESNNLAVEAVVLTTTARYPEFHYGDEVLFEGFLREPQDFETDSGRTFNYRAYLAKDGIYYVSLEPKLTLKGGGKGNFIKQSIFSIKNSFTASLQRSIPEPEVSLLGGLLLGAKQSLGKDLQETLRRAGIIHIVVLSGYNITIIAEAIMRILSFLYLPARLSLGAISIILFAVMTGASATVVRASLMALLVLLARATGRTYDITRALIIVGAAMVFHNPNILLFDPSFQLSFAATLGLIYCSPAIERYFKLVPTRFQLREFATATIATQLFVLPLILFMTGNISLVALPTNLAVLAFVPLTMLVGFFTGITGFVSAIISLPFSYVSYFLLHYELSIATFLGNLPYATISIPFFPSSLLILCYVVIAFFLFRFYKKQKSASLRPPDFLTRL